MSSFPFEKRSLSSPKDWGLPVVRWTIAKQRQFLHGLKEKPLSWRPPPQARTNSARRCGAYHSRAFFLRSHGMQWMLREIVVLPEGAVAVCCGGPDRPDGDE